MFLWGCETSPSLSIMTMLKLEIENQLIVGKVLPRKFYSLSTLELAKNLLGKVLVKYNGDKIETAGIIVETEAYLFNDPACHAARGKTPGNMHMFGAPGTSYVYQIYGIYFCFNVVSNKEGVGEAVLIRALQPVIGMDIMKERRQKSKLKDLCSGPGKLCQSMGLTKIDSSLCLRSSQLQLRDLSPKIYDRKMMNEITATNRIGINVAKDLPYRFYLKSEFISRK